MFIWSSVRWRDNLKTVVKTSRRRRFGWDIVCLEVIRKTGVGHKVRWLEITILKMIGYNYYMIIVTVIGLPTNGLTAVHVYCHYCVHLLPLLCTFTVITLYVYFHYFVRLLPLLWTFTAIIVYVYCYYCVRLLSLLCRFTAVTVCVYCYYCERLLLLLCTSTAITVYVYCHYCVGLLPLLFAFTAITVNV
jgi:hypothetical protein